MTKKPAPASMISSALFAPVRPARIPRVKIDDPASVSAEVMLRPLLGHSTSV